MDERDSVKFDFERSKLICSEAPSRLALLRIEIDALEIKIKQEMIMMKIRNPEFWR
jgi:type II secretory pathway component HofQ